MSRDFRTKRLKPGQKSLWEQKGRETAEPEPEIIEPEPEQEPEQEDEEKFKLIKGLMKHGLRRVFEKKK